MDGRACPLVPGVAQVSENGQHPAVVLGLGHEPELGEDLADMELHCLLVVRKSLWAIAGFVRPSASRPGPRARAQQRTVAVTVTTTQQHRNDFGVDDQAPGGDRAQVGDERRCRRPVLQ